MLQMPDGEVDVDDKRAEDNTKPSERGKKRREGGFHKSAVTEVDRRPCAAPGRQLLDRRCRKTDWNFARAKAVLRPIEVVPEQLRAVIR